MKDGWLALVLVVVVAAPLAIKELGVTLRARWEQKTRREEIRVQSGRRSS